MDPQVIVQYFSTFSSTQISLIDNSSEILCNTNVVWVFSSVNLSPSPGQNAKRYFFWLWDLLIRPLVTVIPALDLMICAHVLVWDFILHHLLGLVQMWGIAGFLYLFVKVQSCSKKWWTIWDLPRFYLKFSLTSSYLMCCLPGFT